MGLDQTTGTSSPSPRILWIDDQVTPDDAATRLLVMDGFAVDCAGSGAEGLEISQRTAYDAVILDLRLPDIPGLIVLEALTNRREDVPVLVLTGYADLEAARIAGHLGAVRFGAKPVGGDELSAMVRQTIAVGRAKAAQTSNRGRSAAFEALSELASVAPAAAVAGDLDSQRTILARGLAELLTTADVSVPTFLRYATVFRMAHDSRTTLSDVRRALQDALALAGRLVVAPGEKVASAIRRLEGSTRPHAELETTIAQDLFVDPGHLARLFREETGLYFWQWRVGEAMRSAVRRVAHTRAPISEIAWDVGFEHLSAFDREFGRVFGASPTAFRRAYGKKFGR